MGLPRQALLLLLLLPKQLWKRRKRQISDNWGEELAESLAVDSGIESSEMEANIIQFANETMSQNFCFKCRLGNVLRKCSFVRATLTLEQLITWVANVHGGIPPDQLLLEYRDSSNAWAPLHSDEALEAAVAPVRAGTAQSIFTRVSIRAGGAAGGVPPQASSPGAAPAEVRDILESAVV